MNTAATPVVTAIPLTEGVIVAMCGVIVALLGLIGKAVYDTRRATTTVKRDVRAARHQVENDHKVNLRDDVDGKHVETMTTQVGIAHAIAELDRKFDERFDGLDDRLTAHVHRMNNTDQRINNIERRKS